jgi:hypothetical protein
MGVAEGVIDRLEPAIRQEVVVHDDAPLQTLRDRAPLFPGAIEGEGEARRRVQPLQRACDAKPGFVEAANLRLGHALADALINLLQFLRLLSHQATMLAGQISGAPMRSLSACAVRSSGMSCWILR